MPAVRMSTGGRGTVYGIPSRDRAGREVFVCIQKYTFTIDPLAPPERAATLAEEQREARMIDEWHGDDPSTSSIRYPSDNLDRKPGTEVLVVAHAHPPPRSSASHVDVSLRVGPIQKTVRAHGVRAWERLEGGKPVPGPARPIREPVPLIWELAWGGLDVSDPARWIGDPRNTVGRGVAHDPRTLLGQAATRLQHPSGPVDLPWGFGALHRHWEPRAKLAGTFDEAWQETRMPIMPLDFDERFHISAPRDQWVASPLRGDEPFEVVGASELGLLRFQLPRLNPRFTALYDDHRTEHRPQLDTILIDTDALVVEVVFRAALPLPRKWERLEAVHVVEKELVSFAAA